MLKQIHLNTFLAVPRYILHDLTGDTRCEIGDRLDSVRLARNNIPRYLCRVMRRIRNLHTIYNPH